MRNRLLGKSNNGAKNNFSTIAAYGEPQVWMVGFGLVVTLLMVVGLVGSVFYQGLLTFWPEPLVKVATVDGRIIQGEVTRTENFRPDEAFWSSLSGETLTAAQNEATANDGQLRRFLVRQGNYEITGEHFVWVSDFEISGEVQFPKDLEVVERMAWGRLYGTPIPHPQGGETEIIRFAVATGGYLDIEESEIVRRYAGNDLNIFARVGLYLERWVEFLIAKPREANSEGGVFPAIFGTVVMTLGMTLLVVPFGVMTALYLREYAKQGWFTRLVRVSINNLAGVPSIVFGVFGMGFFSYLVGGKIDALFFAETLPNPTFGTGGIMWASLTLALLTLPVVIVASEEALAAVPDSVREGSLACGATKWQTIQRVVLPRALPGIMTGAIMAMARGAGEVAPLMLVGAVKLAPDLPIDMEFPFVHLERSFMHLGFHIYDLGFQSQNSEAAKPMVFTTTMLLMSIVLTLNLAAIWMRARLGQRFGGSKFS